MPTTACEHREEWHLVIIPDPGEDWPVLRTYGGTEYRPDRLEVTLTRQDHQHQPVRASGHRIKRDGGASKVAVSRTLWQDQTPAWITELVAKARAAHNVTDEALERS